MIKDEIAKGHERIVIVNPTEKYPYQVYIIESFWNNSEGVNTYRLDYIDAFEEHIDAVIFAGNGGG